MHTEIRKRKRRGNQWGWGFHFYKHTESMRGESRTGLLRQMRHAYFPLESCLYDEEEEEEGGNIRSSILLFLCWASPAQLSPPNTLIYHEFEFEFEFDCKGRQGRDGRLRRKNHTRKAQERPSKKQELISLQFLNKIWDQ